MAFSTGRFGVQYHPRGSEEPHVLRWLVVVAVVGVLVAFACFRIQRYLKNRPVDGTDKIAVPKPDVVGKQTKKTAPALPLTNAQESVAAAVPKPPPGQGGIQPVKPEKPKGDGPKADPPKPNPPKPEPVVKPAPPAPQLPAAALNLIEKINRTMEDRPPADQSQLRRLIGAEREGKPELAIDAIRKLYTRPTMADLRDPLMRRWGDLNYELLFSGKPTTWTTLATVRRGDGLERIAREHNTTPAAVRKLNPKVKWERLKPGDSVRVLAFPSATLVVYASYADLSLNKNVPFFRRYYLSISKAAANGVYPVESGHSVSARFRELGIRLAPADRAELEMFLAAGSRIVVSSGQ